MFCHKRWGAESRTGWLYNPCCIYTPPYWLLHFPPYFFSLSFSISSSFIFTRLLYTHIWSYLASKKPNPLSYIVFHDVFFCIIPSGSPQLSSTTVFSTEFFQELSFLVFPFHRLLCSSFVALSLSRSYRRRKKSREFKMPDLFPFPLSGGFLTKH